VKRPTDSPPTDASQAENQAATWLVRLDADHSVDTLRHWQAWMKEDVRRRAAFVRLEQGWRQTECLKSLRPLDGSVNPNVLDTFPGAGIQAPKPKVACKDLAIQTVAVALAAGMLASKLIASCWLFINLDGLR